MELISALCEHDKTTDENVKTICRPLIVADARKRLENVVVSPYMLNLDQQRTLQSFFSPRMVVLETRANHNLRLSQHPICAVLREYAADVAYSNARRYQKYVSYGDSFSSFTKRSTEESHLCCNVDCSMRYDRTVNQIISHESRNWIFNGTLQSTEEKRSEATHIRNILQTTQHRPFKTHFCTDKFSKCVYSSSYAISLHAFYDIHPSELPELFYAHKHQQMEIWMFLPVELISEDLMQVPNPAYNLDIIEEDGVKLVEMSFNDDESHTYVHKLDTWKAWLTTVLVKGEGSNIALEVKERFGPLVKIHAFQTPYSDTRYLRRKMNFKTVGDSYSVIPDVLTWVAKGCSVRWIDLPRLIVNKNWCDDLYKYALSKDDSKFSFSSIMNYARSLTSSIIIGGKHVRLKSQMNADYFDRASLSVIMLAASARVRRTKAVATFFKCLHDDANSYVFGRSSYQNWVHKFFEFFRSKGKVAPWELPEESRRALDMHLSSFGVFTFSDVVLEDVVQGGIIERITQIKTNRNMRRRKNRDLKRLDARLEMEEVAPAALQQIPFLIPPIVDEEQNIPVPQVPSLIGSDRSILDRLPYIPPIPPPFVIPHEFIPPRIEVFPVAPAVSCISHPLRPVQNVPVIAQSLIVPPPSLSEASTVVNVLANFPRPPRRVLDQPDIDISWLNINEQPPDDQMSLTTKCDRFLNDIGYVRGANIVDSMSSIVVDDQHPLVVDFGDEVLSQYSDDFELPLIAAPPSLPVNPPLIVTSPSSIALSVESELPADNITSKINVLNILPGSELINLRCERFNANIFCQELTYSSTPALHDLMQNANTATANLMRRRSNANTYLYAGVPGAGKSKRIVALLNQCKFNNDDYMVIVPTRTLRDDYLSKKIASVYTMHSAIIRLAKLPKLQLIIVDEAWLFPLAYFAVLSYASCNIIATGDPHQIKHVDFTGASMYTKQDHLPLPNFALQVTHRCPQIIANLLSNIYGFSVHTTSTIKGKIMVYKDKPIVPKDWPLYKFLCFTQEDKVVLNKMLSASSLKLSAETVHEAQGSTHRNVLLYVTQSHGGTLLFEETNHFATAITRHTHNLVIFDSNDTILHRYPWFEFIPDNVDMHASLAHLHFEPRSLEDGVIIASADAVITTLTDIVPVSEAEELLMKFVQPMLIGDGNNDICFTDLPGVNQGSAIINADALIPFIQPNYAKLANTNTYGRMYSARDKLQTLRTLFGRYAKVTKEIPPEFLEHRIDELLSGLNAWVDLDKLVLDEEIVWNHYVEYLQRIHDRGHLTAQEHIDSIGNSTREFYKINFFQKQQFKFDSTPYQQFRDKFGQGVSAWTKSMNTYVGAYVRAIHEAINNLSMLSVYITNGVSDDKYGDSIKLALGQVRSEFIGDLNYVTNDFSEFDSCQNEASLGLDARLLEIAGAPSHVVEMYKQQRSHWRLEAMGVGVLDGVWKKHSGEPGTLTFNTTFNMAVMGHVLIWDKLVYAGFKGDDSLIIGVNVRLTEHAEEFCDRNNYDLKFESPITAEFIGYVVGPFGFFPDVIKRVAKFHSSRYTDINHLHQAAEALKECMQCVRGDMDLMVGSYYLAAFYKCKDLDAGATCIRRLACYLMNAQNVNFDLHRIEATSVNFSLSDKLLDHMLWINDMTD